MEIVVAARPDDDRFCDHALAWADAAEFQRRLRDGVLRWNLLSPPLAVVGAARDVVPAGSASERVLLPRVSGRWIHSVQTGRVRPDHLARDSVQPEAVLGDNGFRWFDWGARFLFSDERRFVDF